MVSVETMDRMLLELGDEAVISPIDGEKEVLIEYGLLVNENGEYGMEEDLNLWSDWSELM